MAVLVICSYAPHAGKEDQLAALVPTHVPLLQAEGLATDTAPIYARHEDGTLIEIFEWASREAAMAANTNDAVRAKWGEFAALCDFVPLANLKECQSPFAHFDPV